MFYCGEARTVLRSEMTEKRCTQRVFNYRQGERSDAIVEMRKVEKIATKRSKVRIRVSMYWKQTETNMVRVPMVEYRKSIRIYRYSE